MKSSILRHIILLVGLLASVSLTATNTPPCGTPTGLMGSNITPSSITIAWNAVSGATSYQLYYKKVSSPATATWQTVTVNTTTKLLIGLQNNASYQFRVRAKCGGSWSTLSAVITKSLGSTYYLDADADGYGNADVTIISASLPVGYVINNTDCNDSNSNIHPTATEYCDLDDNDCNTLTDDADPNVVGKITWYADADNDLHGNPNVTTTTCFQPAGYINGNTDCNDADANLNPSQIDLSDGIDNDCDGLTDEDENDEFENYYLDTDQDGFGDPNACPTIRATQQPTGYAANSNDCDDNNAAVNPNATEICNGMDDNCDGSDDEGLQMFTYYQNIDNDGYGNSAMTLQACSVPTGYTVTSGDCNDSNADVNPAAIETCNGIDDNCNSITDEGVTTTYYQNNDNDGYGNSAMTLQACSVPTGYTATGGDCNDSNNQIYPSQTETCNSIDDNCNGTFDENLTTCTGTTTISVSNITATTATVGWAAIDAAVSYQISYRQATQTASVWSYMNVSNTTNQATLSSLLSGKSYYTRIRAQYSGNTFSALSPQAGFTTLSALSAPVQNTPEAVSLDKVTTAQSPIITTASPNPTTNLTTYRASNLPNGTATLTLTDTYGKMHRSTTLTITDGSTSQVLDLHDLPVGIYIIALRMASETRSTTILKQ